MAANKIEATLQEHLKNAIVSSSLLEEYDASSINIEIPKDKSHGDYSTNIAMQLTRVLHRNPREIAQAIMDAFSLEDAKVEKIEMAGPGFINFFMKNDALTSIIKEVLSEKENYGSTDFGKGIKYDVEFVSANPTGDLHLGHAKGAAVGDSICRIMSKAGYDVTREYYINDAGKQITNLALSLYSRYLALFDIERAMPEDGYFGQDIKDIALKVKEEAGDKYVNLSEEEAISYFRELGTAHELQKIKDILKEFRVSFDVWFSETRLYNEEMIQPVIDELREKGYLYEEDGALWFRTTDFEDDKDRVLIKKDGSYTYFTPDIAYHRNKLNRGYDYLVDLLGADHHGYINRMKAAIQALGYNKDQLNIDIMQLVQMVENGEVVKMSKRTGNAVTIKDLIEEIGVDATRYFFVSKAANTPFEFDLGLAKSQSNENPVYYAQYAHARMCSIMRSANEKGFVLADSYELLTNSKETDLLKQIGEFRNVINDAARTRAPHKITNYIQKLAQLFHSFYNDCHVLDEANKELSQQRMALCEATRITLANALNVIGVSAPEKM
ncbi:MULTISPECIES: arginine--tRNA ligase [Kandleria]|jgi:arginyl-tRNA synthetase|uniref:Arginine--tRNA ligase n=1 Tax=Kandleria vitulina DSM 20405 TaxID=1410657 RepID=A0A0R2HA74_9FIRM|nr:MULTISPECIES: arginine--tRNA ligase [Kandleria]KRN49945.1 arginyl-tRNA synthetase [Kandleria vitulina DSM 20405]MBP3276989.1 arginine--tRNA ligase [Kandleria sp.]SDM05478.1 arginyl-tRNA synthetase [Kandleria vitulina]SEJ24090.1 arginyl-tRNA synthetase [Kandleria vitulina]